MAVNKNLMLFTGNANPEFAKKVAKCLHKELGRAEVSKFCDGETSVTLLDDVRGSDAFILQPTCIPTNDNLMELLVLADTLKRSSAGRITAAIPYFGYARQDRRPRSTRVPISAKLVANMLTVAGIDRVLTIDLHADQIQGFFDIPVDNIYASPVLLKDIREQEISADNFIMISPDTGGVARARAFAKALTVDMAIIDKRRPKANEAEVLNIIGDVKNKNCIIIDDMIDTATTLCKAAEALKNNGALKVLAYATHPIFSNGAIEKINESHIDEVVITDTIPLTKEATNSKKIRLVTISALYAETIRRVNNEESISLLLKD